MLYSLVCSPGDSLLLSASADGTAKVMQITGGVEKVYSMFGMWGFVYEFPL